MRKSKLVVLLILTFIVSCSPQKRLDRLIKNNPGLATTDTVYTATTFTVPGFNIDTNFKASQEVSGLSDVIENYKQYLDSVSRIKLTNELKTYIINRDCLEDTFKVMLENKGFVKLWQKKELFYYQIHQPKQNYSFRVPVSVSQYQVSTKNNWIMFWIGFSVVPILITMIFVIGKIYKPV